MSTIARDPTRALAMVAALGYILMLAAALIWLHLSPLIILGLTIGGFALAICALRPIVAVHGMLVLIQFEGVLSDSLAGELGQKALGVIIVLAWMLNIATDRSRKIRLDGLLLAMLGFLVWCALLLFFAIDAGAAAGKTLTFVQLAIATLMFGSVIDTPRRLRGIYWAIVCWTTLSAIVGILQYLSGATPTAVGLIGNRNLLALYLNIAIVCAYLLHQGSRQPIARLVLGLSIPFLFLGLALTFSRGGLIVLGVTITALFVRAARQRRVLVLILTAALISTMAILLPVEFWTRVGSILPSIQKQEDTFGMRVRLWRVGLRMIMDHPIRGVGPGNFMVALPRYARGEMIKKRLGAHNSYVSVTSEMGFVGLALFLLLHGMAFRNLSRASRDARRTGNQELALLAMSAELCILVIMLSAMSGHFEHSKYLWMFFGLSIAIRGMSAAKSPVMHDNEPDYAEQFGNPATSAVIMQRLQAPERS